MDAMKARSQVFLLSAGTALFLVTACSDSQAGADVFAESKSDTLGSVSDQPLAAFQSKLLDIAFEAATALPVVPHIKNRSRVQEVVVAACFELDQPRRALGYIEQIENWRRGAGYADFAFYCAQHGDTTEVQHYLDLAEQVSESSEDAQAQEWRRDRIRAKIARTHHWLGQVQQAARFEAGVADSELGEVGVVKAMLMNTDAFDEQINALDTAVATGNFDQLRNMLPICVQLFNRFYGDRDRVSLVEEKIKVARGKLPVMIGVELMMELARIVLDHNDRGRALELVSEAQLLLGRSKWNAEFHIPLIAQLAELRYRAGDKEKARSEVDAALARFDAERNEIVNIYRAETLRPLAEAYHSMGDRTGALMIYKRALEEGVENPNSWPRAEDLSATCCSIALHEVEPDAELWDRISQIHDELGPPW